MKTRDQDINELRLFLENNTALATRCPSISLSIATRLYDEGWRRQDPEAPRPMVLSADQATRLATAWAAEGHPKHTFEGKQVHEFYCRRCGGGFDGIQHRS